MNLRRVENPTNRVVDELAGREGLVATLVGNNPETGRRQTDAETVEGPETPLGHSVESGMRKLDVLWGDVRVERLECVDETSNDHGVLQDIQRRTECRALEAVSTVRNSQNEDETV